MWRNAGITALSAAVGWVALAACQLHAAVQSTQLPVRMGRSITAHVPMAALPAPTIEPAHSAAVVEQYRPRPSWAGVVGRASLASGESVSRLSQRIYFCHTGGIYGP